MGDYSLVWENFNKEIEKIGKRNDRTNKLRNILVVLDIEVIL